MLFGATLVSFASKGWCGSKPDRVTYMPRNIYLPFALLLLLIVVAGCEAIEKAPGEHTLKLTKPTHSDQLVFADENIKVRFTVTQRRIEFTLWNRTQQPLGIIWDETILRDPEGETHWVLNSTEDTQRMSTKTAHATTTHPHIDPTIVPPGSSISEYIKPFPSGFQEILIYPSKYATGSRIKLIMPLEINGLIKVYTFGFEVVD